MGPILLLAARSGTGNLAPEGIADSSFRLRIFCLLTSPSRDHRLDSIRRRSSPTPSPADDLHIRPLIRRTPSRAPCVTLADRGAALLPSCGGGSTTLSPIGRASASESANGWSCLPSSLQSTSLRPKPRLSKCEFSQPSCVHPLLPSIYYAVPVTRHRASPLNAFQFELSTTTETRYRATSVDAVADDLTRFTRRDLAIIGGSPALSRLVAEIEERERLMLLDHLTDAVANNPSSTSSDTTMATNHSVFASAPVIVPTQPNGYFGNSHYGGLVNADQPMNGITSTSTPNGSIPPTPGSLAGRKRSRGDIFDNDGEDEEIGDGSVSTELDGVQSRTSATPGLPTVAEAEPSMWTEANMTRPAFELAHAKRPSLSSRKSQRKAADSSGSDDLAQLVLPPQMREVTAEPLIDEATRALGISWARMDSTEALRINKAAYSKWIQNFYLGLENVEVWFENSALPGYLVEARNVYSGQTGYYIFSHDLTEARLVTTESAQLLPRLRLLPALHLAAPGGHIRAETDPATASQNELDSVQAAAGAAAGAGMAQVNGEPNGMCAAHSMELD